ncbi:TorF family putative porin [Thiomicrorhabdus indica]|uniref:TorF family putative porin n=2 Tax=Thiomicrorhabdus indica TaxID=2267253 RepID=UPI00102DAFE8|nr:TorF family putative porin [Thiomicrorhabdus indica]
MKMTALKTAILSAVVAGSSMMAIAPATAQAGVSANAGMVSNYVFRGVEQTESASASAGLDYEHESGFYIGTWAADVEAGLEYDLYAGWSGNLGPISAGVGVTGYYYTDDAFDDTYQEVNFSLGYDMITVGYDRGTYDNYGNGDIDYDHMYVSLGYGDFSGTYGILDGDVDTDDTDVKYLDLGYSFSLAEGLDGGVNYIYSDTDGNPEEDQFVVLSISKSFDLM